MEKTLGNQWDHRTLDLCSWLISRATTISTQLMKYNLPSQNPVELDVDGGWKKVTISWIF